MKYIWQNYDVEKNFVIAKKPLSPYIESEEAGAAEIFVNPVPRFYEIFAPLHQSENDFAQIENCLLHYLAQLDLKSGIHLVSIFERKLDKEICENVFGTKAREIYLSLNENERRIILIYLQRHEAAQGLKSFFFDAALQFFPKTKFYFHESEKKFLFCIPEPKTEHNEKILELLMFFLFDFGANYEIFWNRHFGIIDADQTAKIDNFIIY